MFGGSHCLTLSLSLSLTLSLTLALTLARPLCAMVLQLGERVRHPLIHAVEERDGYLVGLGVGVGVGRGRGR